MIIVIGCDHAAFDLKETIIKHLENNEKISNIIDCNDEVRYIEKDGKFIPEAVDYPDIAKSVCEKIINSEEEIRGILICGTGIGMSIAANKFKGIRAAVCSDIFCAEYCRLHNNANVLCMGARVINADKACELTDIFVKTEFEGGRHSKRLEKIEKFEN
ncbi:MAG: ribose 5-phosphate isomerase B [Oscillospiraceae bacterium]|jgi:ribose 5-phosphate isomerase B|nr:ribose 5-phosphate isomerase B [Oscillospiraceae bacterium]